MPSRTLKAIIALACLATGSNALADCAGASLAETRESYDLGLKHEQAGKLPAALSAFVAAQEYTCETNPLEADAARRAAAIGARLGAAAEKKGAHEHAFDAYDAGGHYADADRALMALVRAQPDSPQVFEKARSTLQYRAEPAFQSNNKVRLGLTGAYQSNPKNLTEVLTMPAKGAERAFQKEAAAFNEQYLRELVQLTQSTPNDPTDFEAMQAAQSRFQVFAQKWQDDPLKTSREALDLAKRWGSIANDEALRSKVEAQRTQVLEQHVALITRSYSGAPKLIEEAISYQFDINLDETVSKQRVAAIKSQSGKLGDDANAKQRYLLAAEYYSVADQDAKAQAARDRAQQIAMAKMQPSMDAMQKQAEQMRKQYSDPEKVKAMQAQAEAMRKSLQQQQQTNAKSNAKRADDLEKELGL